MAEKRAGEAEEGARKAPRLQTVVLRLGSGRVRNLTLSSLLRYPDSMLARMVADLKELNGDPEVSHLELDLGPSCDPALLDIALHIHAHGSICGAPLPPDVTHDWLRTEVLQRYGLPPLLELSQAPPAGTSADVLYDTLPAVTRILREASVRHAVTEILGSMQGHLVSMHRENKYNFVFCVQGPRLLPHRLYPEIPEHGCDEDVIDMEKQLGDSGPYYYARGSGYAQRLAPATKAELEAQLQRVVPGCAVAWQRRETRVYEGDDGYDVVEITWG